MKISIVLLLFLSCNKDKEIEESKPNEIISQGSGNNLILNQTNFGNSNSSIYKMVENTNGNFYFSGLENNQKIIGEITKSGTLLWVSNINFNVRSFREFQGGKGVLSNALIVTGTINNQGVVALFSRNGAFISDIVINSYSSVILNDCSFRMNTGDFFANTTRNYSLLPSITIDTTSVLFSAYGGIKENGVFYPYIHHFTISTTGQFNINLSKNYTSSKFFSNLPNQIFSSYVSGEYYDDEYAGSNCDWFDNYETGSPMYFSSYSMLNDTTMQSFSVIKINSSQKSYTQKNMCNNLIYQASVYIVDSFSTLSEIKVNSSIYKTKIKPGIGSISKNFSNIIIGGYCESEFQKSNKPTDSDYWSNLCYCSVNEDGSLKYVKEVKLSSHNDQINSVSINNNDELFIGGVTDQFWSTDDNKMFGYGFIAKINTSNGDTLKSKTFGYSNYRSGFNSIVTPRNGSSRIYCGGFTNLSIYNGNFKDWFLEIDKTGF